MQNNIYVLEDYEFIRISGADRSSFLQGQLSCNTELLSTERSLTGALCNLKGRVIADLRLVEIGEDIIMQCAAGMAGKIHATLSKYAVFSKVELEQLDGASASTPQALGIIGDGVDVALSVLQLKLPDAIGEVSQSVDYSVVRLPSSTKRVEIWFHELAAKSAFLASSDLSISSELQAWARAEIEAGIIHVTPALSEEYTPQLLNYDISGLIDFKKGCYTGQEIVARMFYRGTAKKRLYLASSNHPISGSSQVVADSADDSKGTSSAILVFNNFESPALLLAILASDAAESGQEYRLSDQLSSEVRIQNLAYTEKLAD
jgi:folate-binding protein YgfZ